MKAKAFRYFYPYKEKVIEMTMKSNAPASSNKNRNNVKGNNNHRHHGKKNVVEVDGVKMIKKTVVKETKGGKHTRHILTDLGVGVMVSSITGDRLESTVKRTFVSKREDFESAFHIANCILTSVSETAVREKSDLFALFCHSLVRVDKRTIPIPSLFDGTAEIEAKKAVEYATFIMEDLSKVVDLVGFAQELERISKHCTQHEFRNGAPHYELDEEKQTITIIGLTGPNKECVATTRSLKTGFIVSSIPYPDYAKSIGVITRGVSDQLCA